MREGPQLLQLDFQRYSLFQQVLKSDRVQHKCLCLQSRKVPACSHLQLLLQFAVKPGQHCICLLVSSYRRLNRLFVLSYGPKPHNRSRLDEAVCSPTPKTNIRYLGMEGCVAKTAAIMFDFWGPCCSSSGRSSSSDFNLRRTGFGGGASGPDDPLT